MDIFINRRIEILFVITSYFFITEVCFSANLCNTLSGYLEHPSLFSLRLANSLTCELSKACAIDWSRHLDTGEIDIRYLIDDPAVRRSLRLSLRKKDALQYKIRVQSFVREAEKMHQQFDHDREIESVLKELMKAAKFHMVKTGMYAVIGPPPGLLKKGGMSIGLEIANQENQRGSVLSWSALSKVVRSLIESEDYQRLTQFNNHFLFLASPVPGEPPLPMELEFARQTFEQTEGRSTEEQKGQFRLDLVKVTPAPQDPNQLILFEYRTSDGVTYFENRNDPN